VTTNTPMNQRAYFIDGPARGQSVLTSRQPSRVMWDDEYGAVHTYRRVTYFRSAHFYRHDTTTAHDR
jgi:hypothetical protein